MEQQLDKQITTDKVSSYKGLTIDRNKRTHNYKIINDDDSILLVDKSIKGSNTACYWTLYYFTSPVNYDNIIGIEQVVQNINKIDPQIFDKTLFEFNKIFGYTYEYEYNEEMDCHWFKIIFGKNPIMGKVKTVLDSVRYLWELDFKTPITNHLNFNFDLQGPEFIEHYYKYIRSTRTQYSGHSMKLADIFNDDVPDIDLFLSFVESYPEGKTDLALIIHIPRALEKYLKSKQQIV